MANYELFRQRLQTQREEWTRQQSQLERQQTELGASAPPEIREEYESVCAMLGECESKLQEMDEIGEERWGSVGDALESAWDSILQAFGKEPDEDKEPRTK